MKERIRERTDADRERDKARRARLREQGKPTGGRSKGRGGQKTGPKIVRFVALDGEGVTRDDGSHDYVLIANSFGATRYSARGLSTDTCLEFLLSTAEEFRRTCERNQRPVFVGFGLGYDTNQWLRDLNRETLSELWNTGRLEWRSRKSGFVLIEWLPGKLVSFRCEDGRSIEIFDVFGFFQRSFLRTLEDWRIAEKHQDYIARMKSERQDFTTESIAEIKKYCVLECKLLVELMDALKASLKEADLLPRQWYGPGAVAATLLGSRVKRYHRHDEEYPERIRLALLHAYYGGRTEMFRQGMLENVWSYDIRSAYPAAAAELPALDRGHWRRVTRLHAGSYAIYKVSWDISHENSIAPFPFRTPQRSIEYPLRGAGWYHGCEVEEAMRLYPDGIRVHSGYVFEPASDEKPFAFVPEFYELRRRLKAEGKAAEYAYKLALNSLYGKLAQGTSRRYDRETERFEYVTPPFQSYFWAGYITARTRARLLEMMAKNPYHIVFAATDAVSFTGRCKFDLGDSLGKIEESHYDSFFLVQPGVYHGIHSEKGTVDKSRGFFLRDLDFDLLQSLWQTEGRWGEYGHYSRKFVGAGTALMRKDFTLWRRWKDEPRILTFMATRKWYQENGIEAEKVRRKVEILYPPDFSGDFSSPYVPKHGIFDRGNEDLIFVQAMEQPVLLY
jgi:hypothetical protein